LQKSPSFFPKINPPSTYVQKNSVSALYFSENPLGFLHFEPAFLF